MTDALVIYVVYDNPLDYPGEFVLKRDFILKGEVKRDPTFVIVTKDYKVILELMQKKSLHRMARWEDDDPAIKETWV